MSDYTIKVDPPDPEWDIAHWTVQGDLRPPGTGFDSEANYEARDHLEGRFPDVEFDPESACFFAYAKTSERAEEVVDALAGWLRGSSLVVLRPGDSPPTPAIAQIDRPAVRQSGGTPTVSFHDGDDVIDWLDEFLAERVCAIQMTDGTRHDPVWIIGGGRSDDEHSLVTVEFHDYDMEAGGPDEATFESVLWEDIDGIEVF